MFLFIFESIGTSELLLIGVIALIFLGPRKLPQMAKTIGKSMAEFRRATNEFKSTWEREVDFESYDENATKETTSIPRVATIEGSTPSILPPEIKEVDPERAQQILPEEPAVKENDKPAESDKRSWL
jgi:Tat protein translocase TatB subunit